jgi:hypothetical protein
MNRERAFWTDPPRRRVRVAWQTDDADNVQPVAVSDKPKSPEQPPLPLQMQAEVTRALVRQRKEEVARGGTSPPP